MATRTRVKVCGLTRPADASAAVAAGVDALGVVLAKSPRRVSAERAAEVLAVAPAGVARIAVLVDVTADVANAAIHALRLDGVQFSGAEPPESVAVVTGPVVKTLHVRSAADVMEGLRRYVGVASAFLLDTHVPGAAGGTGLTFDWGSVAPLPEGARFFVGGGLTPDNVGDAIRTLRPWAVDVSSGLESAPGEKDHALIEAFCEAVRRADREVYGE